MKASDFQIELVVNGAITSVTADTGAKVSVCGKVQAKKWNLLKKLTPTSVLIKPYNSPAVPAVGMARCSVTFGHTSIPVCWYVLEGTCEPILSGNAAVSLGIIQFTKQPPIIKPINMINEKLENNNRESAQYLLAKYSNVFRPELGKHKHYKVKLHVDPTVKPIVSPPRPTPYHMRERVDKAIQGLIDNDVIEEHPVGEPAPWISNAVYVPKPDGTLRVTLDARNINRAIISSNLPIPRQEDIKAELSGSKIFTKLDFKWSFFQFELLKESRSLTVFNLNDKLYRYKRLLMGIKPAQGELNAALSQLFRHIRDAHVIHDDVIVASENIQNHLKALEECLAAIEEAELTLNEDKCWFCYDEVKFWGMLINSEGVQPDPEKVEALEGLEPPKNKEELSSFLCMMQSVAEFIPSFSRKAAPLRELGKQKGRFKWESKHQKCFQQLLSEFRKDVLLRYYDMNLPIYIFTDAHKTGLGAILAQGESLETARPVAVASRSTTDAEQRYPQIDLEGLGIDYALYRFRQYLVGAPRTVTVVTDHMPLCSIFNGTRTGSIRTERYKQRNQDIKFKVIYQKGRKNQTDYLSRRAIPITKRTLEEQQMAESINNLLYTLHTTPIVDRITLRAIAEETEKDPVLKRIKRMIVEGQTWIGKDEDEAVQKFKPILPEITVTGNGILLKGDRMILPSQLQDQAISLAHQGSHPRQNSMERRLRFHFFFHDMYAKVAKFLASCADCPLFTNKNYKEPQKAHEVPVKCWSKVAVDLFGPMPSRKHVVVVQDLSSRFPEAKLVSSTAADKVLPALKDIYDSHGNPDIQLSDNGPPFNSAAMKNFAEKRGIKLEKIPPLHPSGNPVETFMKPLGKAMKIANHTGASEAKTLNELLNNYRDTPHSSTGIPPSAMMYGTTIPGVFPSKAVSDAEVERARAYDQSQKESRQELINSSKYKKSSGITPGDFVIIRNYNRRSKYQPLFNPEQYIVIDTADFGRKLVVKRISDGQVLVRHPDDVKLFKLPSPPENRRIYSTPDWWKPQFDDDSDYGGWYYFIPPQHAYIPPEAIPLQQPDLNAEGIPTVQQEHAAPQPQPQIDDGAPVQHPIDEQAGVPGRPQRMRQAPNRLGVHTYDEAVPLDGEQDVTAPWWPGYPRDK